MPRSSRSAFCRRRQVVRVASGDLQGVVVHRCIVAQPRPVRHPTPEGTDAHGPGNTDPTETQLAPPARLERPHLAPRRWLVPIASLVVFDGLAWWQAKTLASDEVRLADLAVEALVAKALERHSELPEWSGSASTGRDLSPPYPPESDRVVSAGSSERADLGLAAVPNRTMPTTRVLLPCVFIGDILLPLTCLDRFRDRDVSKHVGARRGWTERCAGRQARPV